MVEKLINILIKNKYFKAILALGLLLATALPVTSCSKANALPGVEIKEYQGEKLGSVNDFRENSIKGPQQIDISQYRLKVSGLVDNPVEYTYDEVLNSFKNYQKLITLDCVERWSVKILWEGFLIKDILAKSNVSPDAKVVIFHAYDGYTSSLPVDYLINNNIMLAYKMNDIVMPPERGFPFEVVAESKWGYKWVKWVTEIELSSNENYRGYWESYGYSNSGDRNKPFFD